MSTGTDNIRIAKNTIVVYLRLIITAVIGLITSRYVLQILGASDFGLYSVIGGVIALFTFISASLQATTVRFINYEMGKPAGNLMQVFNTARQIHILFAILIFIAAEIIGIYYIQHFLNVESGKMEDAFFIFHVSLAAACLGIINVPYQGLFVAHELFSHVACIDIITVILKLLMVLFLFYSDGNVLRIYALGMSLLTIFSFIVYHYLCQRYWPSIVKYKIAKDKKQHKDILVFNSYTLLNTASLMGRNQGSNLLINYFFGTVVNAAYTISNTVHIYVNTFAGCFDQAAAPQITQSLSRGDNQRALYLVNHTCRVCILLVEIVYFTLMADLDFVLRLWLGENIPDKTTVFCHLTLLLAVISATSGGLTQYIIGVGRLKRFSFTTAILYALALIVGTLLYRQGAAAYTIISLFLIVDSINRCFQLMYLRNMTNFPVSTFLRAAYARPAIIFIIGSLMVYGYQHLHIASTSTHIIGMIVFCVFISIIVFYIGLYAVERNKIMSNIIKKWKHE